MNIDDGTDIRRWVGERSINVCASGIVGGDLSEFGIDLGSTNRVNVREAVSW